MQKWKQEFGYSVQLILKAAEYAYEARAPMAYLDRLLTDFHEQGIHTAEEMDAARQSFVRKQSGREPARSVIAQQYPQRANDQAAETPEEMLERLMGGGRHA